MLTPQEIEQARQKYGITPVNKPATLTPEQRIANITQGAADIYKEKSPYQTGSALTSPTFPEKQGENPNSAGYVAGAVGNLPTSAARGGVEIVKTLLNTVNPDFIYKQITQGNTEGSHNTIVNLVKLASGALQKGYGAISGNKMDTPDTKTFDAVAEGLHQRYGNVENINRTLKEDPAGVLFDVATILEGGGALTRKLGAEAVGSTLKTAGEAMNPVRMASDVVSGGTKFAKDKIISNLQEKEVAKLADSYREVAGVTKPTSKVLQRSLDKGKDPAQFLAENNIVPEVESGKIRTTAGQEKLDTLAKPMDRHLDMALEEADMGAPKVKIIDARTEALRGANSMSGMTESSRQGIIKDINIEYDLLKKKYGDEVTRVQLNQIKQSAWQDTKFDSTKPYKFDSNYQIGRGAKVAIEKSVPKDALPVQELNNAIGDMYDSKKFLNALEGRVVKGGRLGNYFARLSGIVIGKASGIPGGSILGLLGGEGISNLLQKTTFSNPLKQMILENLKRADPQAYTQALKYIQDTQTERATRLALPPPSQIPLEQYKGSLDTSINPRIKENFSKDRLSVQLMQEKKQYNFNVDKENSARMELRDKLIASTKRSDIEKLTNRFKSKETWLKFVNSNPMFVKKIQSLGTNPEAIWNIVNKK